MSNKQNLALGDLDYSFVPQGIRNDDRFQLCLRLALQSGGKNQRYGALVVRDDTILGSGGCNRLLKKGEPFPFKTTFFLHAERAAIGSAIMECGTQCISGATVYVGGLFVDSKRPQIRRANMTDKGSCVQCARLYVRFGLSVAFMSEDGWVKLSGQESLTNALRNSASIKAAGISKAQFRRSICL
jgi:hypothetical protein